MADIEYSISADSAKAEAQFNKLANKQGDIDKAADKTNKQLANQRKRLLDVSNMGNKAIASLKGMALGFVSVGAAVGVMRSAAADIKATSDSIREFEDEMTALLSLGDNINMIAELKNEVLDLSIAFRRPSEEVARFLYDLQSGTANLSSEIREGIKKESLELAKATGTDLATALGAVVKSYQLYGDQVTDVNDLQNKLMFTADQGYLTFQDLGTLLPDVAAAARAMNVEFDDLLGMIMTATQYGGKNEKTFTGIRNVILRMSEAEEKGIKLTGDLQAKLEQLSKVEGGALKDVFGDEAIAVAKNLAEHYAEVAKNAAAAGGVSGDLAAEKIRIRTETDPAYARAERIGQAEMAGKAATIRGPGAPGKQFIEQSRVEASAELKSLGVPGWISSMLGWFTGMTSGGANTALGSAGIAGPGIGAGSTSSTQPDFAALQGSIDRNTDALERNAQASASIPASGQSVNRDAGVTE